MELQVLRAKLIKQQLLAELGIEDDGDDGAYVAPAHKHKDMT